MGTLNGKITIRSFNRDGVTLFLIELCWKNILEVNTIFLELGETAMDVVNEAAMDVVRSTRRCSYRT